MWSYVGSKANQVWIWLAMDLESRQVVAAWVGGREIEDAWAFRRRIPHWYLEHACVDTDGLRAYAHIFNRRRHTAWSKGSGMTSHIERLNLTLRTRIARLNRFTICFSKSFLIHKAYIFNFLHHYNQTIAPNIVARDTRH